MGNYQETIFVDGGEVKTLRDILPDPPGLKLLIVGKTPAPLSVAAGHYFQGKHGKMFWSRLREHRILTSTTDYEDDSLLDHGFGMTDIAKFPRHYGIEPSISEYKAGADRIIALIRTHQPKLAMFVYKKVLDEILLRRFEIRKKSSYGFNDNLRDRFGSRVFVFPLPGTPCTREKSSLAMNQLADALGIR